MSSRSLSIGQATIIAALITGISSGIFGFFIAKQTQRVEVTLRGTGEESLSIKAASNKIEDLTRKLTLAEEEIASLQEPTGSDARSEEVGDLLKRIETLKEQLEGKDRLIAELRQTRQEATDHESSSATTPTPQVEKEGFGFAADGCSRLGSTVTCDIIVTNLASDSRSLALWTHVANPMGHATGEKTSQPYGTAVDEFGNEYVPKGISDFLTTAALNRALPPSVPVRIDFAYEDVAPNAEVLTLILGCTTEEKERDVFQVVLREIAITS